MFFFPCDKNNFYIKHNRKQEAHDIRKREMPNVPAKSLVPVRINNSWKMMNRAFRPWKTIKNSYIKRNKRGGI